MTKIAVIVPVYNEPPEIVRRLVLELVRHYTVILVDDGSTPALEIACSSPNFHLLRHPANLGQGAALGSGMALARQLRVAYAVHFDADGQHRPTDIPALLAPLQSGHCDVSLGSRFLAADSVAAIPFTKRQLLQLARLFHGWALGIWLTDAHNGLRAFNHRALHSVSWREPGRAHASEILLAIRRQGLRCREVPVHITYDHSSKKKPLSLRQIARLARRVWGLRRAYTHSEAAPSNQQSKIKNQKS